MTTEATQNYLPTGAPAPVAIGDVQVGAGQPVYVIGEIGINHNGDIEIAKQLIDVAAAAGANAVKFQKRTPEISTPADMRDKMRSTPWGEMTYLDYRYRVEFDMPIYQKLIQHAADKGLHCFASPWDVPSVAFMEEAGALTHKVASASVTDIELLTALRETGKPIILSTGMSTIEQIDKAVETLGTDNLILMHATSTYPLPAEEANLRMITTLQERYRVPVLAHLDGTVAHLVGEEGRGIRTILEMVALTRLDCMLGSAAEMRRALVEALHHTRHRRAFVGGDDVTKGKPHPEPYLRGASLLGVDAAHCIAIEDSTTGLASAVASGAVTIGVPAHIHLPPSTDYTLWPTLAGRSVADLRAHFAAARKNAA